MRNYYDVWFSEANLYKNNDDKKILALLEEKNWFILKKINNFTKTSLAGDEKTG
jgi:hypothetical protein